MKLREALCHEVRTFSVVHTHDTELYSYTCDTEPGLQIFMPIMKMLVTFNRVVVMIFKIFNVQLLLFVIVCIVKLL